MREANQGKLGHPNTKQACCFWEAKPRIRGAKSPCQTCFLARNKKLPLNCHGKCLISPKQLPRELLELGPRRPSNCLGQFIVVFGGSYISQLRVPNPRIFCPRSKNSLDYCDIAPRKQRPTENALGSQEQI